MIDFINSLKSHASIFDEPDEKLMLFCASEPNDSERRHWCHNRRKEPRKKRRKQVKRMDTDGVERLTVEEVGHNIVEPTTATTTTTTSYHLFSCNPNRASCRESREAKSQSKNHHMQAEVPSKWSSSLSGIHLRARETKLVRRSRKLRASASCKPARSLVWTLLALLLFLLILPSCFTILHVPFGLSIMSAQALHLDDESSHTPASSLPSEEQGDSDSYTQIPTTNDYAKQPVSTTPQTLAPSSQQQRRAGKQRAATLQVSETELMSFADFNVQQPAFSDLMRSWPPTTVQAASRALANSPRLGGPGSFRSQLQAGRSRQPAPSQQMAVADLDAERMEMMGSHLNEDLDDTIVTADQSFEQDQMPEPPTWINYLGELGDYIYSQLRAMQLQSASTKSATDLQSPSPNEQVDSSSSTNNNNNDQRGQSSGRPSRIETIDELLDDHYYDQYENSQVLYYGPQLVREGEGLEIGCYLPLDQKAEWTKSGRPLAQGIGLPKMIHRSEFLGAKQNYSLKIFVATISDSGNYRCTGMSRKYHKLVVVPAHATTNQRYVIQQRLLSVVNPKLVTAPHYVTRPMLAMDPIGAKKPPSYLQTNGNGRQQQQPNQTSAFGQQQRGGASRRASSNDLLLPGYLIVENKPLVVNCNITDEFVLRRLRENPHFQLAWFKNGKQLRGSLAGLASHHHPSSSGSNNQLQLASNGRNHLQQQQQQQQQQQHRNSNQLQTSANLASQTHLQQQQLPPPPPPTGTQRVQFLRQNGRQLYISSAQNSDAGEYLCSWSKLPARQKAATGDEPPAEASGESFSAGDDIQRQAPLEATIASTPLAAGHLVQLMVPVKLRPFKSTYHVRQGNQLRLTCMAQRGYPAAHMSWYAGNRLVDAEFLREHADEFRVLHLEHQNQLVVSSSGGGSGGGEPQSDNDRARSGRRQQERRRIVEINPIPSSRQQMALTSNGRGQWIEYRELGDEKYAIETSEQQHRYMQMKLAQLTGAAHHLAASPASGDQLVAPSGQHDAATLFGQTSLSVLVINSLDLARHSSRYACRATTRANTDEVTTVIRVQASSTIVVRPSSGKATLIPGQKLHFECENVENKKAQFKWFRTSLTGNEVQIQPGDDDTIEIHNERLTLQHPRYDQVGDYTCRVLDEDNQINPDEYGTIQVRTQPYIEDFGRETSHTGKSITVTDGERLELICSVHDKLSPVNITWLRSVIPDNEKSMMAITDYCKGCTVTTLPPVEPESDILGEPEVIVETLSSHSKRLLIDPVKHEHRSYYACVADNGVTEKTQKVILVRVKDRLAALWPFLGIVAQFFVLFTIIHIWDTQRAYKEIRASSKRPVGAESVPLTSG